MGSTAHVHTAPPPPAPHAHLTLHTAVKTLLLVRHAQGYHNAAGDVDHQAYKREDLADAHLTPRGWRQASALNAHLSSVGALATVQAVVVSPLQRTLETAAAAFACPPDAPGAKLVARAVDGVPGTRAPAPALYSALPFIAVEAAREESGHHPCDRRRPAADAAARFVGVDFSGVPAGPDTYWDPHAREGKDAVRARARQLAAFLLARPETTLAVVSHAGFLHFFATELAAALAPGPRADAARWFDNAECRVMALVDASAADGGGRAHAAAYAGGGHADAADDDVACLPQ